jgi:hypothetical protein
MLLATNIYPAWWNGSILDSVKWTPFAITADNHTILPNVPFFGTSNNQGTTGTCPSNSYDVYISTCDFVNNATNSPDYPSLSNIGRVRALKMCSATGCAVFTYNTGGSLVQCNSLICWVVDPTNTYSKPIVVTILSGNSSGGVIPFTWSASSQFLQNQTIFRQFQTFPSVNNAPVWLDTNGLTGPIGFYTGQSGVTGGRILLAGANNTL